MSDRKSRLDPTAIALLVGCTALWGLNQTATKVAMAEVPPLLQAGTRSLAAALLLALWCRLRGLPVLPPPGTLRAGLAAGALFAGEFGLISIGLLHTSASRLVVFLYLAPFIVALGMPRIAPAERLGGLQRVGLAVAFAGLVAAFAEGLTAPAAGPRQWLGDALALGAALMWAGTTLVIRGSRLGSAPPEATLLYQLTVSGGLLSVAGLLTGETLPAQISALTGGSIAFQVVIVTFASYLLWFWLVRHYPATQLSAYTLLTPIFGLLAGVLLLDEPLTPRLLLGLGAVAVGIVLVSRPRA